MSNLVFPTLAGLGIKITRKQVDDVRVLTSLSGRELRTTWSTYARYAYTLDFSVLRSAAAFLEVQKLSGFFTRHRGTLDSFLFTDPEDNAVAAHYFGTGDGTTTGFQLQRTLVADADLGGASVRAYWPTIGDGYEPVSEPNGAPTIFHGGDWQGTYQLYSTARTNLCLRSQTPTDASWTKTTLTDGGAVAAPDATSTAEKYTASSGGATLARSVAGLSAAQPYIASGWIRCAAGGTVKLGTTEGASAALNITSSWQRFTWAFTAAGTSTTLTLGAGASWGNGVIFEVWGFQLEAGATATSYIPTTSAAVTVTDYTLSGSAVTLVAPLAVGSSLSWTGSYYRRVRFDAGVLAMDRIVTSMWEAKQVSLISVKPSEASSMVQQVLQITLSMVPRTEVPAGTINGTTGSDGNATFTLSHTPLANTALSVYLRGAMLQVTTEYTISGVTLTMLAPKVPLTGDVLQVVYFST